MNKPEALTMQFEQYDTNALLYILTDSFATATWFWQAPRCCAPRRRRVTC